MEQKFSQQLKKRAIAYYLQKHQIELSYEEAEQYLSSMARFCSTSIDKEKEPKKAF